MTIASVLRKKGNDVISVSPETLAVEVARLITSRRIGAVLVRGPDGQVQGIVSERDIVRHLQTDGAALLQAPVAQIMTVEVHTCSPEDHIEELAEAMTERRIRHVPVVADGRLHAIVSIGDVVKNRIDALQAERDQLRDYIQQ